jgi:hypothetical protein
MSTDSRKFQDLNDFNSRGIQLATLSSTRKFEEQVAAIQGSNTIQQVEHILCEM